jgi:hypothetical protein
MINFVFSGYFFPGESDSEADGWGEEPSSKKLKRVRAYLTGTVCCKVHTVGLCSVVDL